MVSGTDWDIDSLAYHEWIATVEAGEQKRLYSSCQFDGNAPLISIVMPTFNTPLAALEQALDSVIGQRYTRWQLCIADDASTDRAVRDLLRQRQQSDNRIGVVFRDSNGGIAAASNDALALAAGEFVAFMDHDDMLPEHALYAVASTLQSNPAAGLLFSDSDHLDASGSRCRPFFKPDWNYELFLAQNYLNHLSVYRRELLEQLGGLREGFEGSQDYDLALRAVESLGAEDIVHIPQVLYHWRDLDTSVSRSGLAAAVAAARNAVQDHLRRTGQRGSVVAAPEAVIYNRVQWELPDPPPRVAMILVGPDRDSLTRSAQQLAGITEYAAYCVEIVATGGHRASGDSGLVQAVSSLEADIFCLIEEGLIPRQGQWLADLVALAARPGVGCVSAKCLSGQGNVIGVPRLAGVGGMGDPGDGRGAVSGKGYYSRLVLDQNVGAVQGGILVLRRELFLALALPDEYLSDRGWPGAHLALRAGEAGLSNVWTAHTIFTRPGARTHHSHPLVVDLDGSLIQTDILAESGLEYLHRHPGRAFRPLLWLREGRARLKEQLAREVDIDVSLLPYEPSVLALIRDSREAGREVVLATASHRKYAEQIADHLGLFDRVIASEGSHNLKGAAKARELAALYGEGAFDYVGNEKADLPVWSVSHTAYLVNPGPGCTEQVQALGMPMQTLRGRESSLGALLDGMQLGQWVKNALIFVPLITSHQLLNIDLLIPGLFAFLCFGLCSSSACLLSGLLELQHDRTHPTRRNRPIPAGRLSIHQTLVTVTVLPALAFPVALLTLPLMFTATLFVYYLMALAYVVFLKPVAVMNVIVPAMLYTMPVVAGGFAFQIELGFGLLAFSMFLLLGLALVERFSKPDIAL